MPVLITQIITRKKIETLFQQFPDIDSYLSMSFSPTHAFQLLILKPKSERVLSTANLIGALTAQTSSISGVRVNVFPPQPPLGELAGGDDSGDNIGLVMMTSSDYRKLQQTSQAMMDLIKQNPGFLHVDNTLKWDSEQFQLNIDRDKAADLRVPLTAVTNTLSTLIAGRKVGKTDDQNIFVQMNKNSLGDPNIFQDLYVRNMDNKMIALSSMLNVNEGTAPEVYRHYSRLRADTIYLMLDPGLKIADAITDLQSIAKKTLPDDVRFTFTGEAKTFLESSGKTAMTFMLALIFIYLVLVAQFESFIDPLIILLTVPFAVVGALITLKIFGGTLNIYSNIGMITLVGLISKHGILITDFANRLRMEGKSVTEAVIQASILRLRPILMTTSAMVLGALPLAFAFGPGAESRQQIGLVISGGLLFGTLFSLVVVPVTYSFLAPLRNILPATSKQEEANAIVL